MEPIVKSYQTNGGVGDCISEGGDDHYIVQKKKKVTIASFPGGGIRGFMSAALASEVEGRVGHKTGDIFDMLAGTSAGAICAASLVCPEAPGSKVPLYSAADVSKLFRDNAVKIFPPAEGYGERIWSSVRQIFYSKYSSSGLRTVLDEHCKDLTLSDCIKPIVIPVSLMPQKQPCYFTRKGLFSDYPLEKKIAKESRKILLADAIQATASAPTFFPEMRISVDGQILGFRDGGFFANDPETIARCYAEKMFKGAECLLVSFGTGLPKDESALSSQPDNSGWFNWMQDYPTDSIVLTERNSELQMKALFSNQKENLLQLNPVIPQDAYVLDGSDPAIFDKFESCVRQCIEDHDDELNAMCLALERNMHCEGRNELQEFY